MDKPLRAGAPIRKGAPVRYVDGWLLECDPTDPKVQLIGLAAVDMRPGYRVRFLDVIVKSVPGSPTLYLDPETMTARELKSDLDGRLIEFEDGHA